MSRVLRSMLYVPANSWRMIVNATSEGADAVILDLEDGCPMPEKETGRIFARDSIPMLKEHGLDVFVRVNSLETDLTEADIGYVVVQGLDGIMLAKTESKEDMLAVDRLTPEEYFPMVLFARSSIAVTARAAGIQAIDTPFFGLVIDLEGLREETEKVRLLGFSGKQLTHPRHVATVNEVFSPAKEEIDFANQVVEAYADARTKGLGATTIGGKMIDFGSFKRAEGILRLAEAIEQREKAKREGSD